MMCPMFTQQPSVLLVRRHVVFCLTLFLFPSGVQVSAVFCWQVVFLPVDMTKPCPPYLFQDEAVVLLLLEVVPGQYTFSMFLRQVLSKLESLLVSCFVSSLNRVTNNTCKRIIIQKNNEWHSTRHQINGLYMINCKYSHFCIYLL